MGFEGLLLRIRPSEIEFDSNFSSISQHLRSTEYSTFLITENLRINPSEIECEGTISTVYQNKIITMAIATPSCSLRKFLRIRPTEIVISSSLCLISIYIYTYSIAGNF